MKYLAAALASVGLAAAAAPPPHRPGADLRQAVRQYDPGSSTAPRQLTAEERAQLRKQLTDYRQLPVQRR